MSEITEISPGTPNSFATSWMRVVEKPSVWHQAIHALVQHEHLFRRYVSPNKHVIVNSNDLLHLLFFILANDNVQWRDSDVKMNILCWGLCRLVCRGLKPELFSVEMWS